MRIPLGISATACLLVLATMDALACSCLWAGGFLVSGAREPLIVRATVVQYVGHGMDVEVLETLKGATRGTSIRIWGDTGILCRPYVSNFPRDSEWIFAIRPSANAAEDGYVINGCGEYAVRVQNGRVSGLLTEGRSPSAPPETMTLDAFRARLRNPAR